MVASRVALGSVSTLALAGLLLGVAPRVFSQSWGTKQATPWGTLASFSGKLSTAVPSDGDRSQLLKFAALKSTQSEAAAVDPAMAAAAQLSAVPVPSVVPATPAAPQADQVAVSDPPAVDPASPAPATSQAATVASVDAPLQTVSAEPAGADREGTTVVPQPRATPPSKGASALININKASADALDRFPGAGHIGHAIVTHRPYRSIAELVKKRVLTNGDFRKIQGRISVD